jgi:hypothetical protein
MSNRVTPISLLGFAIIISAFAAVGCSQVQSSTSPQIDAIKIIREHLDLPPTPLEFIEMTGMINSPSGNLEVAHYQDTEGRMFFVNPESNQVVEIDARSVLPGRDPDIARLTSAEVEARAMEFISASVPDFENLSSAWQYEEGVKGENYFFTWSEEIEPGSLNRAFAQIGINDSGVLFAYYNTLLLDR